MKLASTLFAVLALLAATSAHAADYKNEIGASASQGLSSSDPGSFGAIFYQRHFDSGLFLGGSLGGGSVLQDRKSVRLSARLGYRASVAGWGQAFQPLVSVEAAAPMAMGNDSGSGTYLNLGFAGALQERFMYGLELQLGRVKQTEVGLAYASGSVKNLRASVGVRF